MTFLTARKSPKNSRRLRRRSAFPTRNNALRCSAALTAHSYRPWIQEVSATFPPEKEVIWKTSNPSAKKRLPLMYRQITSSERYT
ncbi:MAG: hypothetical protein ACRETN_13400, partial [Nevskiales bacterium]